MSHVRNHRLVATLALAAAVWLGVAAHDARAQAAPDDNPAAEMEQLRAEMQQLRAELAETQALLTEARQRLNSFAERIDDDTLAKMREWDDARREYESARSAALRARALADYERGQMRQTAYREQQRLAVEDAARPAQPEPKPGEAVVVRPDNNAARPGFVGPDDNIPSVANRGSYSTPYGYGTPFGIRNYGSVYNQGYYGPYSYGGHGTTVYSPGYFFHTGTYGLRHVYDYYPGSGRYEYVTPHRGHHGHHHHGHHSGSTINIKGGYQGDKLKLNFNLGAGSSSSRSVHTHTVK